LSDAARRDHESDLEKLSAAERFDQVEFYLPYLESNSHSLLDYLPSFALVVSDDWQQIENAAGEWADEVEQLRRDALIRGDVSPRYKAPVLAWEVIARDIASRARLNFAFGLIEETFGHWQEMFNPAPRYGGKLLNAVDDWRERLSRDERLVVVSRQAERIAELMRERNLVVELSDGVGAGAISLITGVLGEGFEFAVGLPSHGTADWESAKAKAKRAVDEIAGDLIQLYAQRVQVKGHAFASDSTWQQELEDSFPYAETPDQERALDAIKRDMESERPMDRLVCG